MNFGKSTTENEIVALFPFEICMFLLESLLLANHWIGLDILKQNLGSILFTWATTHLGMYPKKFNMWAGCHKKPVWRLAD